MNIVCPSCHSQNPQRAKFCLNCGGGFTLMKPQQIASPSHCPGCKRT